MVPELAQNLFPQRFVVQAVEGSDTLVKVHSVHLLCSFNHRGLFAISAGSLFSLSGCPYCERTEKTGGDLFFERSCGESSNDGFPRKKGHNEWGNGINHASRHKLVPFDTVLADEDVKPDADRAKAFLLYEGQWDNKVPPGHKENENGD